MRWKRILGAALAAAAALGSRTAVGAPFTGHFAPLEAALAAREAALAEATDPELVKQRAACLKARLHLLYAYSSSASGDLKNAAKIAKTLEKALPSDDPILDEVSGALDGLEGELARPRSILVLEISLLPPAAAIKAGKGLATADLLAAEADLAATRFLRARLLGKSLKKIFATRRALRGGGTPGFQGPINPSFEDQDPYAVYPEIGGVILRNAANSYVGYVEVWRTAGGAAARTGIGAPHGVAKASIGSGYNINTGFYTGSLYQEDVNLSRSRVLRFEWELTGSIGSPCSTTGAYGRAALDVRFAAPSGATVTIGTLEVSPDPANGTFNVGQTSAAFEIPYLPEPGTLLLQAYIVVDYCPPPPPPPPGGGPTEGGGSFGYVMYVDNLRVE
jgi:hypothetical protein